MPLGIYMDNLNDWEDTGEKLGYDENNKIILGSNYSPEFKSRHTLQIWNAVGVDVVIDKWVGESLAPDSSHEIYINNNSLYSSELTFSGHYFMLDEEDIENKITIGIGKTAHFYCTGTYIDGSDTIKLVMRTGSQDNR